MKTGSENRTTHYRTPEVDRWPTYPESLALPSFQEDEVIRLIQAAGLDSAEFTWALQPSRYHLIGPLVSALVHTPTGASFRFEFLESALGQNRIAVFAYRQDGPDVASVTASWEDQLRQVREWLNQLAKTRR